MSNDYLIRVAGMREVLAEIAFLEHKSLAVDDYRTCDRAETDHDRQVLGGYTDVWIERDSSEESAGFDSREGIVAGVRVHGASGDSYQALMPDGHPRSPLRMTSGVDAVDEAIEIMQAELQANPIPAKPVVTRRKRGKEKVGKGGEIIGRAAAQSIHS